MFSTVYHTMQFYLHQTAGRPLARRMLQSNKAWVAARLLCVWPLHLGCLNRVTPSSTSPTFFTKLRIQAHRQPAQRLDKHQTLQCC